MSNNKQILVLGAGVSGLSTGILLLRKGYTVTIWAKDVPPNTTSNKAAAVWYPFVVKPPEKATRWAKTTLAFFQKEILPDSKSGTKPMKVLEVFTHKKEDPWWKDGVSSYRKTQPDELPEGYHDGYAIDGLIMDTDRHMDYLVSWFQSLGGNIVQKDIKDINEAFAECSIVVNCTGLGSRELFDDNEIYPCRGQTVTVKSNGFSYSLFEEEGPNSLAYIIPRLSDIVLGGTVQDNDWNTQVDPKDTEGILSRCSSIVPMFKQVEIIKQTVGLRPARSSVRLEIEKFGNGRFVIHNYGHGGSGFTLSWGCAMDALELLEEGVHVL